jgi:predicted small secreted protein
MLRILFAALAFSTPVLSLTACNMVEGAGEDLQETSENTSEAFENATN